MRKWLLGWMLVVLMAGCTGKSGREDSLVILCGNSFVPPAEELINAFTESTGVKIEYTAAGSEEFLPHVKQGSQGDILVTHDPYLDYTRDAGRLAGSSHVGFVAPVIAVQPGNPQGLGKIEDLTREGLKVSLSNPEYSTCGEMVRDLLKKKGIYDQVMENVGNRLMKGHAQLGTLLQTKSVDAVVMWNGVANTFEKDLDIVPVPYEYDEEIRVHVIGLNYSKNPERVAEFIEFVNKEGSAVFAKHGYVK